MAQRIVALESFHNHNNCKQTQRNKSYPPKPLPTKPLLANRGRKLRVPNRILANLGRLTGITQHKTSKAWPNNMVQELCLRNLVDRSLGPIFRVEIAHHKSHMQKTTFADPGRPKLGWPLFPVRRRLRNPTLPNLVSTSRGRSTLGLRPVNPFALDRRQKHKRAQTTITAHSQAAVQQT